MMKIAEYIKYLQDNYLPNRSDALEFVSHTTGIPYDRIPMHLSGDFDVTADVSEKLARVSSGEPLAYIINNKNFYGMDFYVDSTVLIPRPETEILVDTALEIAAGRENLRVLDICTGSGCILAAMLKNLPTATGIGLDVSLDALGTASKNLQAHGLRDRAELIMSDALTLDTLGLGHFDIITCNPPYLSEQEWLEADSSLKFEPKNALSAGGDALLFYKKLMDMTPDLCNKNGGVLFEAGIGQREALLACGFAEKYTVIKDYQQIERVLSWINS